jgi:hypothetical protein
LLGLAILVAIGRIDEVAARVRLCVEDAAGFAWRGAVAAPGHAEICRPEYEFGHPQASMLSKNFITHVTLLVILAAAALQ